MSPCRKECRTAFFSFLTPQGEFWGVIMNRSFMTAIALGAALYAAPSYAAVKAIPATPEILAPLQGGPQVPASAGSSETAPAVDTSYYFTLNSDTGKGTIKETLVMSDIDTEYTPGAFSPYSGTPNSGTLLETTTPVFLNNGWIAPLNAITVANGDYYVRLTGALTSPVTPVVSITAVASVIPESSTWAMMVLGFAGLGFAAFRTRRSAASIA